MYVLLKELNPTTAIAFDGNRVTFKHFYLLSSLNSSWNKPCVDS